jgi:Zn-dependent protease with chaperone function
LDSEGARPAYWEGSALLFDGRSARARETRVSVGPDGLEVLGGEAAGRYRKGDLALVEKSGDGAYLSLALKPREDHVLEFRDPAALEWLRASELLPRPPLSGMSLGGKAALLVAVLAALSAFVYLAGLDLAVDGVLKVLPRKADRRLGDAVIGGFDGVLPPPADPAARRALDKSRRMVEALGPPAGDSIRILLVADTSVKNAFAFPGGGILVYTGMLRMLETQEEWMGLLAHEGGHVHLRHGMRQVVRASLLAAVTSLAFGDAGGLASALLDNAGTLLNLRYGRSAESEADAFAQRRLEAAGYPSDGLATLFGKFLKLQSLPAWAAFLSTHPATEQRIEALRGAGGTGGARSLLLTAEEWAALKKL